MLNKRTIFTVTTGRSGTGYLSSLLQFGSKILSLHEPDPKFSDVMRESQTNPHLACEFLTKQKIPYINTIQQQVYIETSHLFCKGFFEPLIKLGWQPEIIILRRNHRDVALSLLALDTIPAKTEKGNQFCLRPDDPDTAQLPNWIRLTDYQLCYWYCLEIERRANIYANQTRAMGGKVYWLNFQDMFKARGRLRLLWQMHLPITLSELMLVVTFNKNPVNKKDTQKQNLSSLVQFEEQEQEIKSLFLQAKGKIKIKYD